MKNTLYLLFIRKVSFCDVIVFSIFYFFEFSRASIKSFINVFMLSFTFDKDSRFSYLRFLQFEIFLENKTKCAYLVAFSFTTLNFLFRGFKVFSQFIIFLVTAAFSNLRFSFHSITKLTVI